MFNVHTHTQKKVTVKLSYVKIQLFLNLLARESFSIFVQILFVKSCTEVKKGVINTIKKVWMKLHKKHAHVSTDNESGVRSPDIIVS